MSVKITRTPDGFAVAVNGGTGWYDTLEEALDGVRIFFDDALNDAELLERALRARLAETQTTPAR